MFTMNVCSNLKLKCRSLSSRSHVTIFLRVFNSQTQFQSKSFPVLILVIDPGLDDI
jgi:hypothetical protein